MIWLLRKPKIPTFDPLKLINSLKLFLKTKELLNESVHYSV